MIYTFLNPKGGVGWTHGSRFAAMVRTAFALLVVFLCVLSGALAAVNDEPQFIFNTFSFLVWGGLVMWMGVIVKSCGWSIRRRSHPPGLR